MVAHDIMLDEKSSLASARFLLRNQEELPTLPQSYGHLVTIVRHAHGWNPTRGFSAARRKTSCIGLHIDALDRSINPAKAQRLFYRLLVTNTRFPGSLLVIDQPYFLIFAMVLCQPFAPLLPSSDKQEFHQLPLYYSFLPSADAYAWSLLAAIIKSLRCNPPILCVHHDTVTLPHSVSSAG